MTEKKECNECNLKLHSSVKVGPKGQVVIPKEVRDTVCINPRDEVTVVTKDDKYIGFVKNENINELIEYLQNEMNS